MKVGVTRRSRETHYVGRPTPLGNPFVMETEEDRDRVCDLYVHWFNEKISSGDLEVKKQIDAIVRYGNANGVVRLGCYCSPKRCHAETIAKYLRTYTDDKLDQFF